MKLTPARLELLRAVERGEVRHEPSIMRYPAQDVLWRPGTRRRLVTGALRPLWDAGLVERPPSPIRTTVWHLTDAGRELLAGAT